MTVQDQRKSQRFDLRLSIELVRAGEEKARKVHETRNVSSGGVLFTSGDHLAVGEPIEYFIDLPSPPDIDEDVRLHCVGKITRLEPRTGRTSGGKSFHVAATMERYEFLRQSR